MLLLLGLCCTYLVLGVYYYAKKREGYCHLQHTISELGESGTPYTKQVSLLLFIPVGLGFCLMSLVFWQQHETLSILCGAMGLAYFFSGIFPCDPGTPVVGSVSNVMHNLVAWVGYATVAYQLNELTDGHNAVFSEISLAILCGFIVIFLMQWPKVLVGLTQRLAEGAIYISIALLIVANGLD